MLAVSSGGLMEAGSGPAAAADKKNASGGDNQIGEAKKSYKWSAHHPPPKIWNTSNDTVKCFVFIANQLNFAYLLLSVYIFSGKFGT